ncbi:MAG: TolB family protein, partial [Geminicoccales bacterium]
FVAYPDSHPRYSSVFIVRPDGSEQRELSGDGFGADFPAWSPDGRQLAFDSYGPDRYGNLFVMELSGGALRQLTDEEARGGITPAWSPDGQWIAFSSDRTGSESSPQFELRIVPAADDQTQPVTIMDDLFFLARPSWRPGTANQG